MWDSHCTLKQLSLDASLDITTYGHQQESKQTDMQETALPYPQPQYFITNRRIVSNTLLL